MPFNFTQNKAANTNLEIGAMDFALFLSVGKSVTLPATWAVPSGLTAGDLAPLPVGLLPVGQLDKKAAVALDSALTVTPVESYGQQSATRLVRKGREVTIDVTMQETNMVALGAHWGVDFSTTKANTTTGEVNLTIPETALNVEYRGVLIGKDGTAGAEIYTIYDAPRLTLQKSGKITYNDDGIGTFPATFVALMDSAYGYAIRPSYCGLGWKPLTTAAGFGPAINEVQSVALSPTPTAGTFTLTYAGQTTAGIAYNAIATAVQSALQALSNIGTGNATVTGTGPWTVTFTGALGGQPIALMTGSGTGLTPVGTVTVTEVTAGHV